MATVLIVDDDKNMRRVLSANLERGGFETLEAAGGGEALASIRENEPDCVLTDLKMPGMDGMELLARIHELDPGLPVVLLTAHGTVETAVEAMKRGAHDYLTKPWDKDALVAIMRRAADAHGFAAKEPQTAEPDPMRSRNADMRALHTMVDKVAKSPTTVLISGESGTGKEIIARMLHEKSDRAAAPYIRVNCAAIPNTLVESELFGYDKGAFTGAVGSKPGRFELADRGTLFLDEIGTVPLETQVKLLRAIQEQEFERVGGIKTTRVDVRLIAATNVDLRAEVAAGRFREDLFYRLNVVHLRLPPLRNRTEDLDHLIASFIARFNERLGRQVTGVSDEGRRALYAYRWPGNIRELENTIERAVLLTDGETIREIDMPDEIRASETPRPAPEVALGDLKEASREAAERVEMDMIRAALRKTGGNVTRAAKTLGLSRKGLQIKMRQYGLEREKNADTEGGG